MTIFPTLNEQMDILRTGVAEIFPEDEIVKKIERSIVSKKPLQLNWDAIPAVQIYILAML